MGGYGGFGFFGVLINILFWVLVFVAVVALIKWFSAGKQSNETSREDSDSDEAIRILKMRYAKGDLTKREFESMKKDVS